MTDFILEPTYEIIPVQLEYGAEEFFWETPFETLAEIITWWENQEDIDIYTKNVIDILSGGVIHRIKTDLEHTLFYKLCDYSIKLMIDDNYSSYLFYQGKKYLHKGIKYYP
ncbi:hypothetical protein F889_02658 [Acinetobacter colistiniresistens]|uniref:Uncharacterized protein n=1 Tax=Acinetobacter colistiniresistens TaxID=280145 RepID=N9PKA6_9GAMM|nr:hypothetical protein [Acinetobacter colistiniresistens]ENX33994.1 hypothetical protein F889_02658 [Acinetobacter colistiniresistens]